MKQIEEGCMAIVINGKNPDNIGKITKVGKLKGISSLGNVWEVETQMIDILGVRNYAQLECNLERIDDPDEKSNLKINEKIKEIA